MFTTTRAGGLVTHQVLTLLSEVKDEALKYEKEAAVFQERVDQRHGFMFLDVSD